jgi:hypothetical protein
MFFRIEQGILREIAKAGYKNRDIDLLDSAAADFS